MKNFQQNAEVKGWVRLNRSDDVMQLIRSNPLAYTLATVIALRARWRDGFNEHGLEQGEALLGDYELYGMSEQNYRTAKAQLKKWNFATFKSTNAGTIAKLTDKRLFEITAAPSNGLTNGRVTSAQRTGNERVTTNEPSNTVQKEKEGNKPTSATPTASHGESPPSGAGLVASEKKPLRFPTVAEVKAHLRLEFSQGAEFAEQYHRIVFDKQQGNDEKGKPVHDWKKHSVAYVKNAWAGKFKNHDHNAERN